MFKPVHVSPSKQKVNREKDRKKIFEELADVLPNGCFIAFLQKEEATDQEIAEREDGTCNEPVKNIVTNFAESCSTTEEFITQLPTLSEQEIAKIEKETIGQSENSTWVIQRKGRITASNFYAVFTKVNSLKGETMNSKWLNADPLIRRLMGYAGIDLTDLPSLKYGRSFEPVARENYLEVVKSKHQKLTFRECGLFIHSEKVYLGASPDLLVECQCCGPGVVEIKCPYSIAHKHPSHENLNYLCLGGNGTTTLKHNHAYFAQIQGQMAISKRNYCDFFVYTHKGYFLERINFDNNYWRQILNNLEIFFNDYLADELVHSTLREKIDV